MKKIYLSILSTALCMAGTAQLQNSNSVTPLIQKADIGVGQLNPDKLIPSLEEKATVLWSNTFDTPGDWTLTNSSVPSLDWSFESDPAAIPVAAMAPAAFTSVGDGYLFISSDGVVGNTDLDGTPVIVEATNATPINLTGEPNVVLTFEQNYRWWQETREVRVSGDNGVTWTAYEITGTTSPADQNSGNPNLVSINISAVAGGQSQVLVQFSYNDNDYWGWYWAVDDVQIVRQESNDLLLDSYVFGSTGAAGIRLPYYQIPTTQVSPIEFEGRVHNIGSIAQTGTVFQAVVNGGTFTGNSTSYTSLVGGIDTVQTTTNFTPPATATPYTVNYNCDAIPTDADLSNNTGTDNFEVTDYIYARDLGTPTGGTYNSGNAYETGNLFDIYTTQTLYSIDATIATNSQGTPVIYGTLYSIDPGTGDFIYVDQSDDYAVTADDITNGATITLPLMAPATLNAGESYLVVVGAYGDGGATFDLVTARSGNSEPFTSYYLDGTDMTWYYTGNTPMVRMNFEPNPTVSINGSSIIVNENVGNVTLTVDIADANSNATSVDLTLGASTATNGADFTFTSPTTVTFPAGSSTSQTVVIPITDDAFVESSENILFSLGNATNNAIIGASNTYTVTITDNDVNPTVSFATSSVTVNENVGTVTVDLNIVDPNANATTVEVALGVSTATNTSDFNYTSPTTVTFPGGSSATQSVTLTIIDDANVESSEDIVLSLQNATNAATITPISTHTVTITDNDVAANPVVTFDASSVTVDESAGTVTVNVDILSENGNATSVDVVLGTSTASNGADFNYTTPTTVTFPASSSTTQSVTLSINDDATVEGSEDIVLELQNATNSATVGTNGTYTITITDNDVSANPVVSFDAASLSVNEDAGTILLNVDIASPNSNITTVEVALGASSASLGSDFSYTTPTTVTFPANSSATQTVVVGIIDDAVLESTEDIVLNLQNPSNSATIGTNASYTISIIDNEVAPSTEVSFDAGSITVNENAGTLFVNVTIANENANATSVDVALGAATATIGSDFTFTTPTTVTFPANSSTTQTVVLGIIDDATPEAIETITLTLQNPTNGAILGTDANYVISIEDNEFVSIEENNLNSITMYPNPTSNGIITLKGITQGAVNVEVTNVIGQVVYTDLVNANAELNLSKLTKGSYLVTLFTKNDKVSKKLIIQ